MTDILEKPAATLVSPILLTNHAVEQLALIRREQQIPDAHALRIGVKGGGCSGFSYILGFDERKETDENFIIGGIPVVMQKAHAIYLLGMEIDFVNGLNNRGFTFSNPNAKETCGCGTSFSA
jgi:iron-sulfur cluster assembly protein